MSGRLAVVGLGPGDARWLTPQAQAALADAAKTSWKRRQYPPMVQNGLRHLIAVSAEMQTA